MEVDGRETSGGLACQTQVVTSTLWCVFPSAREPPCAWLGDSHLLVEQDLLPDRGHLSPLYRIVRLTVPPASIEEHYSDWTRLTRELAAVTARLSVPALFRAAQLADALREQDGKVTVVR